MERLVIQYPVLIWTLLNLLHYYLNFLNIRLYISSADFGPKFEIKYDKKFFLKLLMWLGFGIVFLYAYRQAFLQQNVTDNEYFAFAGGMFFLVIGYLLRDITSLMSYFVHRMETPKTTYKFSFKSSMISNSFAFFGYSALMLLSFLISKHPLLLGGTIGLATGGLICICKITGKQQHNRNNQIT